MLRIPTTSELARTSAASYTATVTDIRHHSRTVVGLTVTIADREDLAFLPGQYVNIAVPGTDAVRSYSFSSSPGEDDLEFLVKLVEGGAMSTWLRDRARVGDEITLTGPHGSFFLREALRPVLLLAGGTGLAPVLSMLKTLAAARTTRKIHLVYGATTDEDVVELDTLEALARELDHFTWDYVVADPATTAPHQGYVTSLVHDEHLHSGDAAVYLCGPPPMVEAVRQHFSSVGVEPVGFYYEKFALGGPAPVAAPAPDVAPAPAEEWFVAPAAATGLAPVRVDDPAVVRSLVAQEIFPARPVADGASAAGPLPLLAPDPQLVRGIAGQVVFPGRPAAGQLPARPGDGAARPPDADSAAVTADGYQIGEEHPSLPTSDALFEAREALELGAIELTIGRLEPAQIAGYRFLAHATVPHLEGDRFVDAAAFTETNAAFHDYLFTLTGNQHLLQAYQRLGVKGRMAEILEHATWCHPLIAQDHLDIVDAIEAGDRDNARALVVGHALRSKETMRRAMRERGLDRQAAPRPTFVSPGRFAGKVVVVTGAAQGIGEAVARRIGAEGGALVLADRSELVTSLVAELGEAGAAAISVLADLETFAGAQAAVDAAVQRFGRIDVAVHNVGGTIWAKPFEHYPPDQIEAEINRSLYPTLWGCRAVLPQMIRQGSGTIVNVSSVATRGVHRVPYAAAKGGVNAITAALALEAAPHGIRVVATAPGGTDAPPRRVPRGPAASTEQEKAWYQAIVDQTVDSSLMHRYGTVDEQSAAIAFLASDEASYITGTVLPVAGGDLG